MKAFFTGSIASLAAAVLCVSSPAFASKGDCPQGYMCIFGDSNFTGRFMATSQPVGNVESLNDLTTSVWNRTGAHWCLFLDTGFGPTQDTYVVAPGQEISNIGNGWNDNVSSMRPC